MRSLLLRLYPAIWRARYGDEFEAVLAERPLGPFDVADIVLAALDAHVNLRGHDAANPQGSFTMSLRLGGVAAILGAVLFPAGLIASSIDPSDDPFPGAALMLAGSAALLLALIGLSSFQARQHPRLIWTAFALPALGTALSCIGIVGMAFAGDRPLVAGLTPWEIWALGVIATAIGSALFGLATYHTRALSRPAAGLLATGSGILLLVVLVGATGLWTGADSVAPALIVVGLIAFAIGWIALGWTAIRLDKPAPATAEGVTP